jgi:hypothetical protein
MSVPLKSFGELLCIRENSVIPSFYISTPYTTILINGGVERGLSMGGIGRSPVIAYSVAVSSSTDSCVSIATSISLIEEYSVLF